MPWPLHFLPLPTCWCRSDRSGIDESILSHHLGKSFSFLKLITICKHRKNCDSCATQVTWKVKFRYLSCPSCPSCPSCLAKGLTWKEIWGWSRKNMHYKLLLTRRWKIQLFQADLGQGYFAALVPNFQLEYAEKEVDCQNTLKIFNHRGRTSGKKC